MSTESPTCLLNDNNHTHKPLTLAIAVSMVLHGIALVILIVPAAVNIASVNDSLNEPVIDLVIAPVFRRNAETTQIQPLPDQPESESITTASAAPINSSSTPDSQNKDIVVENITPEPDYPEPLLSGSLLQNFSEQVSGETVATVNLEETVIQARAIKRNPKSPQSSPDVSMPLLYEIRNSIVTLEQQESNHWMPQCQQGDPIKTFMSCNDAQVFDFSSLETRSFVVLDRGGRENDSNRVSFIASQSQQLIENISGAAERSVPGTYLVEEIQAGIGVYSLQGNQRLQRLQNQMHANDGVWQQMQRTLNPF